MADQTKSKEIVFQDVITTAIQLPGVKVTRENFLREVFKKESPEVIEDILQKGPVFAGRDKQDLHRKAQKLITDRTLVSTGASFAAGLPGGFAMAATIPLDLAQFYGVALRMAQELMYLYGEEDLWENGVPEDEKVTNQLILYCGVMLGAAGAAQTVRIVSSQLAKQALKRLPQKALTKTFYFRIVRSIAKALGVKLTKSVFAKGVSKAIPILGGVVSGGITYATMQPMGARLLKALEEVHFAYDQTKFEEDWQVVSDICEKEPMEFIEAEIVEENTSEPADDAIAVMEQLKQAKQMQEEGFLSQEEYDLLKEKLLAKL